MGFKLIVEYEAQLEIEEAIEYYESNKVGLGAEFFNYLDGYFQTLKNGKATFELKRKPVFRELPLKMFPFVIIYEQYKDEIIVYSVFNTDQDPSKKRK
ncbi:conserved protein of unknown function [Tenacibaculum sp. 190524A02b]|uniref:type II toxin-antitoxin system RelE/ParE family toxin n=1 Tax=Tenacibaculum vairaonense TaxID=3137860 RepID=UPI0032B24FD3